MEVGAALLQLTLSIHSGWQYRFAEQDKTHSHPTPSWTACSCTTKI